MLDRLKVVVALDGMTQNESFSIAKALTGKVWGFKVNDLVYEDLSVIEKLKEYGNVFVDVKLHDIPHTVGNSVTRIAKLGADIITVHTSGGIEMMKVAKEKGGNAKIIGVTVLTSTKSNGATHTVIKLTQDALEADLDGVVCGGQELDSISEIIGMEGKLKIVPGIRPVGYNVVDDQVRSVTLKEALTAGADLVVVGRPITRSNNPLVALEKMCGE